MLHVRPAYATGKAAWPATSVMRAEALVSSYQQKRPLSRRIILEALLLTIISFAVFGFVLGYQNDALSSEQSSYGIDTTRDPVQRETDFFQTALPVKGGTANLISDTSYSISAKVESIKPYNDSISSTVPLDLLLSWGEMADPEVDGRLVWAQSDRQGSVSGTLGGSDGADVSTSYVITHVSNSHMVPANDRIRGALATIQPGDVVKIEGRLVDVKLQTSDHRVISVKTSKVRSDQGDGACEIIFVEQIKINNKSYR